MKVEIKRKKLKKQLNEIELLGFSDKPNQFTRDKMLFDLEGGTKIVLLSGTSFTNSFISSPIVLIWVLSIISEHFQVIFYD